VARNRQSSDSQADDRVARTPTPTEVLEAVQRSGFPMEMRVARTLEAKGFETSQNWNFEDPDEGVSREIDVTAGYGFHLPRSAPHRILHPDLADAHATLHVLVECKSLPALVLFARNPPRTWPSELAIRGRDGQMKGWNVFGLPRTVPNRRQPGKRQRFWQAYPFDDAAYWTWSAKVARALSPIYPVSGSSQGSGTRDGQRGPPLAWKADGGDFYQQKTLGLLKAVSAYRQRQVGQIRLRSIAIEVIVPVMVIHGDVYVYDEGDPASPLDSVPSASYFRTVRSKTLWGNFRIDVVRESALESYVGTLQAAFDRWVEGIETDLAVLVKAALAEPRTK
jgi:hypothetical protein